MTDFENEKVIVRRFRSEDWRDLHEIALSNAASPFADCDEQWPTDEESAKEMCEYFSGVDGGSFYAVYAKDIERVVCFVNFNGVDADNVLDIGHVMNNAYAGRDYEYEGLRMLYAYAFREKKVSAVKAYWALHDEIKLEPLRKLGMTIRGVFQNDKFTENADGTRDKFEGCLLWVTKEEFENKGENDSD